MKIFKNKKASALLGLIVIALLIIAACGESTTPTSVPEVTVPEEEAAEEVLEEVVAEEEVAEEVAPSGGKLVIGKAGEVITNDVHGCGWQLCWELFANVYESLVFIDDNLQAIPGLAESWTTPDDTTYVFKLREGVKFHNGREMVADDVVFSINRVRDPDTGGWWGPALMWPVKEVEATGPYEVTITLTQPFAPFLGTAIAGIDVAIVPGAEVRDGTLDLLQDLVGTGPFQVVEHEEGHRWLLKKFDDYWQEGLPLLDEVEWRIIPDDSSRVAALRTGEIDITFFENPGMFDVLADDDNITLVNQETVSYYPIYLNAGKPDLSDVRVRQAISLGIDREALVQLAAFGHASTSGPIPGGFSQWATPSSDLPFYQRDVDRARQLLEDAGYAEGLTLTAWVSDSYPVDVTLGEILQQQLAEIGVTLELVNKEPTIWWNEMSQGLHDVGFGWLAGYADPQVILDIIATTPDLFGVDTTEFVSIRERAYAESDPVLRQEIIRELEEHLATEAYLLPLITRNNYIAYRSDLVQNMELGALDGWGVPLWQSIRQITVSK